MCLLGKLHSEIFNIQLFFKIIDYYKKENTMTNTTVFVEIKNIMINRNTLCFLQRNSLSLNASEIQRKKATQRFIFN